jgi:large subunit ribosomal protein L5
MNLSKSSTFLLNTIPLGNINRFKLYYDHVVCEDLIIKQNYNTICQLPSFKKIIVNTSSKLYLLDKKYILPSILGVEMITGQKPRLTYVKKSIASFKIRENQLLGCKVTLRGSSLFLFLDLFITIILPRLREFSGISTKSFDKSGNFSLGLSNLMIFPELENHFEFFELFKGFNINVEISGSNLDDITLLYTAFQLPRNS